MNANQIEINSKDKTQQLQLKSKEKRAFYMSQVRGAIDSQYRRIERENNARAMRKKRLENSLYRERERCQNRAHMAEIRRHNAEYRQREHIQNRLRMALKRSLTSKKNDTTTTTSDNKMIDSIYQTLEDNLQSSHISFIPYEINLNFNQQSSDDNKQRNEYELVQQIYEYYHKQNSSSNSDSNSLMGTANIS